MAALEMNRQQGLLDRPGHRTRARHFLWQLALATVIFGGSGLFLVAWAQDYSGMSPDQLEQEMARVTAEITSELIRVNNYLVRYDEALGIGVASGMVDRDTATKQLQARGRELYGSSFTDANYRQLLDQHRVATQSYIGQVENAVRNAQTWPDPEATEEYRQLALAELGKLRAEYDSRMDQGRDPLAVLVDIAEISYWTSGHRNLPPAQNPFAGAYQRAAAAIPDAELQQQLTEMDARRWREPERPRPKPIPLAQIIQQALSGVEARPPAEAPPAQAQASTPVPAPSNLPGPPAALRYLGCFEVAERQVFGDGYASANLRFLEPANQRAQACATFCATGSVPAIRESRAHQGTYPFPLRYMGFRNNDAWCFCGNELKMAPSDTPAENCRYHISAYEQPSAAPPGGAVTEEPLGTVWQENESGWSGVWTRRGSSNVFDAVWTYGAGRVTAVLTIQIQGDTVLVSRYQSSDANDCNYSGQLGADRRSVSGTYSCNRFGGIRSWQATIQP